MVGGRLLPLVRLVIVVSNLKVCTSCHQVLPLSEFYQNSSRGGRPVPACKKCSRAAALKARARRRAQMSEDEWKALNAEAVRRSRGRTGNVAGRTRTKATYRALTRLRDLHRAEYDALFAQALREQRDPPSS